MPQKCVHTLENKWVYIDSDTLAGMPSYSCFYQGIGFGAIGSGSQLGIPRLIFEMISDKQNKLRVCPQDNPCDSMEFSATHRSPPASHLAAHEEIRTKWSKSEERIALTQKLKGDSANNIKYISKSN